jgi:hypothetical protein
MEVSQISFDFIRKDETRFQCLSMQLSKVPMKQRNYIQFIVLDITQRKQ